MNYEYQWLPGPMVPAELIDELATLYSTQYGLWSPNASRNPGGRICLSPTRIRELLMPDSARLAYAMLNKRVVGYAIAIQAKIAAYGVISWVTQLVVHEEHRKRNVGKLLLFAIWTFTDHFAWGLLTANPYAIRALEKATRRRCQPARIARNHKKLRSFALQHVAYVNENTVLEVNKQLSRINTEFPIDHSTLDEMLKNVTTPSVPWQMGEIDEGWEWFAFTFQDQEEIGLSPEEIETMLKSSDQVTKVAYSRMLLNEAHRWARFGAREAQFIASLPGVKAGETSILDFGCGTGRHATELGAMGFHVIGIDYLSQLVDRARENASHRNLTRVQFETADCREVDFGKHFDLVLCLYDVIGTYADETENDRILSNIVRHLKAGGFALISVMNLELTERRARHFFSLAHDPDKLLALKPSRTMEQTGNVFDPEYYMIDTDTKIVYRKEQFEAGTSLPAELIVRDRRYMRDEIEARCHAAGLEVLWSRFIRVGRWEEPLDSNSDRAKEILVYCRKP
jgi:2-polyprenyl-3-methyl-5-hydroxy-6-metoxy-1,4-benzoquinol methylase